MYRLQLFSPPSQPFILRLDELADFGGDGARGGVAYVFGEGLGDKLGGARCGIAGESTLYVTLCQGADEGQQPRVLRQAAEIVDKMAYLVVDHRLGRVAALGMKSRQHILLQIRDQLYIRVSLIVLGVQKNGVKEAEGRHRHSDIRPVTLQHRACHVTHHLAKLVRDALLADILQTEVAEYLHIARRKPLHLTKIALGRADIAELATQLRVSVKRIYDNLKCPLGTVDIDIRKITYVAERVFSRHTLKLAVIRCLVDHINKAGLAYQDEVLPHEAVLQQGILLPVQNQRDGTAVGRGQSKATGNAAKGIDLYLIVKNNLTFHRHQASNNIRPPA